MRDGEIVQIGTPDEVVGAPADDYVRDFVSEVPKSHVLTLRWVMRPPQPGEAAGRPGDAGRPDRPGRGPRGAGRPSGPVRVFDGDELVGVVDDEDILRVVVAEDGDRAVMTAAATRPAERPPRSRRSSRTSTSEPQPAHRACGSASIVGWCWVLGWALLPGHGHPGARRSRTRPRFHNWLNDLRDNVQLGAPAATGSSTASSARSATSLDWLVTWLRELISQPRLPAAGAARSAGSAWSRCSPGSPSRSPAVRSAILVARRPCSAVRLPRLLGTTAWTR